MKLINYLLIALVFVSSCKEETEDIPALAKDYGDGMYIVTENGISFYDGEVVKNQIYKKVNGNAILNGKKIKFKGTKAYIVADEIVTANVNTFENKEIISGFVNPVDFDFIDFDRLFVVDKGDSKVKVVDLLTLDITSDIETGDATHPTFIISTWIRAIVLNGGAVADTLKDSTIVAIDYRDGVVSLADHMGSIEVGENPSSAVWTGSLKVLCKGIFDPNNPVNNTESSFYSIDPWNMKVNWGANINGIYNAKNLVKIDQSVRYYFTAEGGIYWILNNSGLATQVVNINSDFLKLKSEWYAVNDSTNAQWGMLYFNDADNASNTIYKYNLATSSYMDTIVVDGAVNDINFY